MVTAVSDTSVNAKDDVTSTAAVSSQETTASQNKASDPGSWLLNPLAPGASTVVTQITTTVAPTDAAASTPRAVIHLTFPAPTVTDGQTVNVETDPVVSFSGTTLVVTDGTVPAIDTVTTVINKVSPSTRAVSLTTEANDVLTPADDVIASAMDAAAPTTISASLATDEVAETTNERSGTFIPATGGIDLVTKIVPFSKDAITLTLDVVRGFGAVPTINTLELNGPEVAVPEAPAPEIPPFEIAVPEAPAPKVLPPEAATPEASEPVVPPPEFAVPEAPASQVPPPEVAANEGFPQIPVSKSNSLNSTNSSEDPSPDAPSLNASVSPPFDAKIPFTTKVVSLPDARLPDGVLPIPKAKHGKNDEPQIDEKEKSESTESRHHGKEKKKLGTVHSLSNKAQDNCKAVGQNIWHNIFRHSVFLST